MRAKITAYNNISTSPNCSNFGINTYWGSGYKNVYYLCANIGRSTFNDTIETIVDENGQEVRNTNISVERYNLSAIVNTPYLAALKVLDKHDVVILENLDTGDSWNITNINVEDDGANLDVANRVLISYEIGVINGTKNNNYVIKGGNAAYWDNDNNGTIDFDGSVFYSPTGLFTTFQLYFEPDLVTPATGGDVELLVYAKRNGATSLVGSFSGVFGDNFSDSTKWLSTQNIWNYFDISDTVGHANKVSFQKEQFAKDNGYYSDETEDRAVELEFHLAIDGSAYQTTKLELVYSAFGAFNSAGVQKPTGEYGVTTISKVDEKMTIQTMNDVRRALPSGSPVSVTAFTQVLANTFTNKYQIDVAPSGEHEYTNTFVTNGGYLGESFRGANGSDNYTFGLDEIAPIGQFDNILVPNTGVPAQQFLFSWKFDKIGTHAEIGNVVNNTAGIYLDGVLAVNLSASIDSTTVQATGTNAITLPDTAKHEVEFRVTTDNRVINNKFECQIKPKF